MMAHNSLTTTHGTMCFDWGGWGEEVNISRLLCPLSLQNQSLWYQIQLSNVANKHFICFFTHNKSIFRRVALIQIRLDSTCRWKNSSKREIVNFLHFWCSFTEIFCHCRVLTWTLIYFRIKIWMESHWERKMMGDDFHQKWEDGSYMSLRPMH